MVPFSKLIQTSDHKEGSQPQILYEFLDAVLARPQRVMRDLGYTHDSFEMHDPMAAYYLVDTIRTPDSTEWRLQKRSFVMERTGEWTKGEKYIPLRGSYNKRFIPSWYKGCVLSTDGEISTDELRLRQKTESE